jgi:hypothetical protein
MPEKQRPRVDHYLCISGGDSSGIKLRDGRIEIKQRLNQHGIFHFGHRDAGFVEHWHKWSLDLAGSSENLEIPSCLWIGVRKERLLRAYRVVDDRTVTEVAVGVGPGSGCNWELATVSIEGTEERWWSIGFEAFGKEAGLWNMMSLVAEHFLSEDEAPTLRVEDSYGYPRWLQILEGSHT